MVILYVFLFFSFVGCIEIFGLDQRDSTDTVADKLQVNKGCIDACLRHSCSNGGICENRVSHAVCDCAGTGYEGRECKEGKRLKFS